MVGLRLWSRKEGPVVPMEVSCFSTPEEDAAKLLQDQDHVNSVFLIGKVLSIMSMPLQAKQLIRSPTSMFFIGWEMQHDENSHSYGQLVIGSFITTTWLLMHHVSCGVFWWGIKSLKWLSSSSAQIWHPVTILAFSKSKITFKGKFQTVDEIQENTTGQLIAIPTKGFAECFEQWKTLRELCEVSRCLLQRLRHRCPMYNVSCIMYLFQ